VKFEKLCMCMEGRAGSTVIKRSDGSAFTEGMRNREGGARSRVGTGRKRGWNGERRKDDVSGRKEDQESVLMGERRDDGDAMMDDQKRTGRSLVRVYSFNSFCKDFIAQERGGIGGKVRRRKKKKKKKELRLYELSGSR
jgi:hypothetical protein